MAKAKRGKSGLKILAADAKSRLKNGFYNSGDDDLCRDYYRLVKSSFECKQQADKERQFYQKVLDILSESRAVVNPIQRLVDPVDLCRLSYPAQQRYLLEVSQKFNKIKTEIEQAQHLHL